MSRATQLSGCSVLSKGALEERGNSRLSVSLQARSEPRSSRALSESIEHPDDYLGYGSVGIQTII